MSGARYAIAAGRFYQDVAERLVAGAREVLTQYDGKGKISGLKFALDVKREGLNRTMIFQLPARTEPIFKIINGRRRYEWDRKEQAGGYKRHEGRNAAQAVLRMAQLRAELAG